MSASSSSMKNLILISILLNALLCASYVDSCNILDSTFTFFNALIRKYVDKQYQNIACLEHFFYRNNSNCVLKNIFLPINTSHCRDIRETKSEIKLPSPLTSSEFEGNLYAQDIDGEEICKQIRNFNQKEPNKTKKKYTIVYNSLVKYAVYGFADNLKSWCSEFGENFRQCVYDANAVALKFFDNLFPPNWNHTKSSWSKQRCLALKLTILMMEQPHRESVKKAIRHIFFARNSKGGEMTGGQMS